MKVIQDLQAKRPGPSVRVFDELVAYRAEGL